MTTLETIGYTAAGGFAVTLVTVGLFGCAVKARSTYIAPRCTARPKETIYNPRPNDFSESQDRGNAWLGWVAWCNSLSYETLLRGVPGTGTRKGGMEGIMLKVNMDGVVLMRFQALCLKVCILITVLCLGVILPINLTARCNYQPNLDIPPSCYGNTNFTNYEITTMAHIPDLINSTKVSDHIYARDRFDVLGRLYGIIVCTWIVAYYACNRMYWEWKTLLALRRVYYLEKDHWSERRKELENSLLRSRGNDADDDDPENPMNKRDPWIPHPEQRDTVVNVGLYSVLVGGLPAVPQEEIEQEDIEAAVGLASRKKLDWQLEFATKYFDACVPNPPGFSSSVAAITILPSAADLANAWGKWYAAAGQLRRLRFIREIIQDKVHYDINDIDDEEEDSDEDSGDDDISELHDSFAPIASPSMLEDDEATQITRSLRRKKKIDREIFRACTENQDYYRSVLGVDQGSGFLSYDFGPEQTAMYSREFAQGAANCCPNGCFEGRVHRATIDELRQMEKVALEKVHAANLQLDKAQLRAIEERQSLIGEAKAAKRYNPTPVSARKEPPPRINTNEDEKAEEKSQGTNQHEGLRDDFRASANGNGSLRRRSHASFNQEGDSEEDEDSHHWAIFENAMKEHPHGSIRSTTVRDKVTMRQRFFGPKKKESVEEIRNASVHASLQVSQEVKHSLVEVKDTVADHLLVRESTYAVVTFVSRQAAVAARQCLADGRGLNRWVTSASIPVPPLADAAPFNIFFCRGCCRPVSLSIHQRQKTVRKYFALALLFTIYAFYTIPLQAATSLLDPASLEEAFPGYAAWLEDEPWFDTVISGLVSGLIFTIFFALCPVMFKFIANFEGNATSQFDAEYTAMQYFWWFYVVTAIWGNSLSTIVIKGFTERSIQEETIGVIQEIANTIPTQISATWLNWILVRSLIVLPLHFLLQMNTYLFRILGWNCCSRAVRGGGPGGTTPYRLYIDGGLVFLCAAAFSPASPLVAPCALLYFVFCGPLIKRNLIFMYRPNFDAGGARWPFLFEILMSSLFVGQFLMTAMMVLKRAYGPAALAAFPIIPCYLFRGSMRRRFLRAFMDASLFHTSELDGLDIQDFPTKDLREGFRRFIVDAHKAAYVPVCLARGAGQDSVKSSYVFTSEPSCVVDHVNDIELPGDTPRIPEDEESQFSFRQPSNPRVEQAQRAYTQFGVTLRRVSPRHELAMQGGSTVNLNDDGSVTTSIGSPPMPVGPQFSKTE